MLFSVVTRSSTTTTMEHLVELTLILSQSLILFIVLIHEMPDIVLAVKAITDSELVICKFKLFLKV